MTWAATAVVAVAPAGDCEALRAGPVAQPVNTVSSLVYVVAGGVLLVAVARRRLPAPVVVLAGAVVAAGVGSVAFHARWGSGAGVAHDLGLLAVLGYVTGWYLGRAAGSTRPAAAAAVTCVASTAAAVPVLSWSVVATTHLVAAGLLVAAAAGGWAWWQQRPGVMDRRLVALAVAAVAAWGTGRSGGVLCQPASVLQPHAVWHLCTATLVVAWAQRASLASAGGVVAA